LQGVKSLNYAMPSGLKSIGELDSFVVEVSFWDLEFLFTSVLFAAKIHPLCPLSSFSDSGMGNRPRIRIGVPRLRVNVLLRIDREGLMRFSHRCAFTFVLSFTLSVSALADVSPKNGNLSISFTDMAFSGGLEPTIERTYNSKTSFKGIFGNGWGSKYEVYLDIAGDGTADLHEWGGGADNIFRPPDMSQEDVQKAADQILAVAVQQGDIAGDRNSEDFRTKLLNDAAFRQGQWSGYVNKGLLQPRQLPVGTTLVSMRFSYQTLLVTRDGYRRSLEDGSTEFFGKDGKLRQLADKNGHYLLFAYAPGQVTMHDDANRSFVLTENTRGLVVRAESSDHRVCTYRYNNLDELIQVTDSDGEYTYEYDAAGRHNLMKVGYPDHSSIEIAYYPREQFENVKSLKDRDGSVTSYTYDLDPKDPGHYTVRISVQSAPEDRQAGKVTSASSYEYFNKHLPDGGEYTERLIVTEDGQKTDTTYNTVGLPVRIALNDEVTSFVYDDRGHVTRKETPDSITELSYDPVVDKVTWVRITSRTDPKDVQESRFTYDAKGNLLKGVSGNETITLQYDTRGRISEMDAADGRAIAFDYNANSKPVTITLLKNHTPSGAIKVSYKDDGSIDQVSSDQGRTIALAVTSTFQELLDIIRPAGVTLSF
jgi:YD repeat-containing protein